MYTILFSLENLNNRQENKVTLSSKKIYQIVAKTKSNLSGLMKIKNYFVLASEG